jgi:hypothetical protein
MVEFTAKWIPRDLTLASFLNLSLQGLKSIRIVALVKKFGKIEKLGLIAVLFGQYKILRAAFSHQIHLSVEKYIDNAVCKQCVSKSRIMADFLVGDSMWIIIALFLQPDRKE